MSLLKSAVLGLAAVLTAAAPALAESFTTRIEPRPYYGAVVTVEQGVRVWRPLPPTRHMIINPTGAPVNLSFADVRETITHNNNIAPALTNPYAAQSSDYGAPVYGVARAFGSRGFNGHHRVGARAQGLRTVRGGFRAAGRGFR